MLRFCVIFAASLAAAQSTLPQTCPAGQCLREEASEEQRSGLGFVQTSLHYKLREQRAAAESVKAESGGRPDFIKHGLYNPWRLKNVNGSCPTSAALGIEVPFSSATAAKFKAFEYMGFINKIPHCGLDQIGVITDLVFSGETVDRQNRLAWKLTVIWGLFSAILIGWSIYSIAIVPKKRASDAVKTGLADDAKAYERGWIYFISLAWVDELVGRYGKVTNALIDDNEIVINRRDEAFEPFVRFRQHWNDEVARAGSVEKASISWALYKTVGFKGTMCMVVITFIEEMAGGVMGVIGLNYFLASLEHLDTVAAASDATPLSYLGPTITILLWIWGTPMIFRTVSIVAALVDGYYTQVCGSGLACMVFHKALRTPASVARPDSRETEDGDEQPDPSGTHKPNLVQLLNTDIVDLWGGLIRDILCVFTAPISIIILLSLMVCQISAKAIGGACYIVPVMLLMMSCAKFTMYYWRQYQLYVDMRLKWLTETLLSIRTMKALSWEKLALEKLMKARDGELDSAKKMAVMNGFLTAVGHTLPWGVLLMTMYILISGGEGTKSAADILICQRVIQALMVNVAQLSSGMSRAMVVPNSFARIKKFLAQPDRPKDVVRSVPVQSQNAPALRVMGSFTFAGTKPVLKDLDIAVPQGELVGVIGRVGSGKSSLLQAIIGELHPANENSFIEGPDAAAGHVAYCAQVPWIFEGTLRENVIMNQQLHQDRYYKCVYAAGLAPDLQILPGGDQVTIGNFGIRLSGGQRARVALARAAYMEAADLILVDDPFASVDGPTGQHIFQELLLGPVMRGRTRLVVTQPDRQRLQHFDRVLLFEDGCVVEAGAPAEVMETEAFKRMQQEQQDKDGDGTEVASGRAPGAVDMHQVVAGKQNGYEEGMVLREDEYQDHITWESIWWWVKAAGATNLTLLLASVLIHAVLELRESLVVAQWINTKVAYPFIDDGIYMKRVLVVVGTVCVSLVVLCYMTAHVALTSARKIHHQCVTNLLNAPVDRFFDKQPVGRLINRLSYDLKQVDEQLVMCMLTLVQFFTGLMTTQTFILTVMPRKIALCALPVYMATGYFIWLYRGTAVPLVFHSKHELSLCQDLQAVVIGQCVSIRANGMLDNFMARYNHHSQSVIRSQYLVFHVCRAWAQSRVFLCFGALTALVALGGMWGGLPMGTLATCVAFCFFQMGSFEGVSLTYTGLLNVLNALQRLMRYVSLPMEAPSDLPGDFLVRKQVKIERKNLPRLQMTQGSGTESDPAVQLSIRGGKMVMQSSKDGRTLEFASNCSFKDLVLSSEWAEEERDIQYLLQSQFQVISINSVTKSPEHMARELCNPPAAVWMDVWNKEFDTGLCVQIDGLTAGYATGKSVLHDISLQIPPCTKCAFVGKTGCGKSTTLLCILRFLEPRQGRILLGGRDNTKLGLRALRRIVGLVPQDPTVFEGNIRFNLDPFGEYPDAKIWEAVQCVQLMPFIRMLPDGIYTHIDRDGSNISFGQKQLISLARMVLRQPPVLLLDECTSALDPVTQEAVQKSILRDFPRTTIIAVAHRLETVLEFDQISVFHEGQIVENGTVQELKKADGAFMKMLQAKNMTK